MSDNWLKDFALHWFAPAALCAVALMGILALLAALIMVVVAFVQGNNS